jgi:hypothetical protein
VLVLEKIAAVLHDENYAGQSNTLLVFVEGVREGIPVKVPDAKKAFQEISDRLANSHKSRS